MPFDIKTLAALGAVLATAAGRPCAAAVLAHNPQGFEVRSEIQAAVSPERAYGALADVGRWWSSRHSLSGDAANMSLDPQVGGCFCEALAGGGRVGWMRVVASQPATMLRLRGGLGPLQAEGVDGTLTWTFAPVKGGVDIVLSYLAGGFPRANAETYAAPVDGVLAEQLRRLKAYLETGAAPVSGR